MKKYFDGSTSLEDLKDAVLRIQKKEDKKAFYVYISIVTAVLLATIFGVIYLLREKMEDEYDEDWDCDWDEYDDDGCCDDDCCCTDKDVDTSVKVEKL